MHYFKHLVFILIFASASLLKANEEASVTVVPFELFAEPSTYVDGVNVASGHFTYSVTDAKISGPCSVTITRNYVQGHTGSLGANWDLNCFGEINIHPLSLTTNVKKGPFTGLSYLRDRKSNALKLDPIAFKRGLTNAQGKINGQTNLKNIQLELLQDYSFLYLQTGAKKRLVYEPTSKPLNFTLVREEFADGFKNFFKDSQYWSEAPSGLKQLMFTKQETLLGEGIKTASFISFEKLLTRYLLIKDRKNWFLDQAMIGLGPSESYRYCRLPNGKYYLDHIIRPEGRFLDIHYFSKGANLGKVKSLISPVGKDGKAVVTHAFTYGDGWAEVKNAFENRSRYCFDNHYRLSHIKRILNEKIYSEDRFFWGQGEHEGNLVSRVFYGQDEKPLFCRYLQYDSFGNVTAELLCGNLKGEETKSLKVDSCGTPYAHLIDTFQKIFEYSQDGYNLLLAERDHRKEIRYTYVPGTNLLASKLMVSQGKIRKRHFYTYNADGFLTREEMDDGSKSDKDSLIGVTERHIKDISITKTIPLGQPAKVQEKYLDLRTGEEKLLRCTEYVYSPEGYVLEEKRFDSSNTYAGSYVKRYDHKGRVIQEWNPVAYSREKRYDANGNLIFKQGYCKDFHHEYVYDLANRLVKEVEVQPTGSLAKEYRYNDLSQRIGSKDIYGNETYYFYDDLGRCVKIIYPLVKLPTGNAERPIERFSYNELDQVIAKTDALGNTTLYSYNVRGDITKTVYPDGSIEQKFYTLEGWLEKEIDPCEVTTTYSYDYQGRILEKAVFSLSGDCLSRHTFKYNAFHLLQEKTPEGITKTYSYDAAGRLERIQQGEKCTVQEYDHLGRVCKIKEKVGKTEKVTCKIYNLIDELIEERVKDHLGTVYSKTMFSYDQLGRCISQTVYVDQELAQTTFEYDSHGRPVLKTDPEGYKTKFDYLYDYMNPLGQFVSCRIEEDAVGNKTTTILDALGRVQKISKADKNNTILHETLFAYDLNGNKILETEIGSSSFSIRRSYDSKNRLISITEADGTSEAKTTSYTYTPSGQQSSVIRPDGTVLYYSYDPLGKITQMYSSDGSIRDTYTYDQRHNLTTVHDAQGLETLRVYDKYNRLVLEKLANGCKIQKTYDELDRITQVTLPDGSSIEYIYHPVHLVKVVRHGAKDYSYSYLRHDLSGNLLEAQSSLMNTPLVWNYSLRGECTGFFSAHYFEKLSYDPLGNAIHKESAQGHSAFNYDSLSQLTQENAQTYRFDSLHNRLAKNASAYKVNALNQLVQEGENRYFYDLNGNLIEKQTPQGKTFYTYDALNRLTSVQTPVRKMEYTYDPFHRRMSKQVAGQTTRYLYEGKKEIAALDEQRICELRILGKGKVADIGAAVALELNGQVYFPVHDHAGNIVQLLREDGSVAQNYTYTAFGEETLAEVPLSPWRFSSKRTDVETGLVYFGERYYNPAVGRWLTPDPIGFLDSNNLYVFSKNNPLKYIDPHGQFAVVIPIIAFAWGGTEIAVAYCTAEAVLLAMVGWAAYETCSKLSNYVNNERTDEERRAKQQEKEFPGTPQEFDANPESKWKNTTHPKNKAKDKHREYTNEETGEEIRYDKGDPEKTGHRAEDHYHRKNPNAKEDGKEYVDYDGNPCHKNSPESHLYPPDGVKWSW